MSSTRGAVSPSNSDNSPYSLPSQYKFLKVLGEGGFGSVLKCLKKDTQETVAIKIPIYTEIKKEATLLKRFMRHNFDQHNIVKFLDSFDTEFGKALVFEELDISLAAYLIKSRCRPMKLRDIRSIIRQTATALDALKSLGVIHADIKPDNIMLVDRQRRPLEVKLIDFGLALPTRKVRQGMTLQIEELRAPEIVLGLPFDEGVDMWSLGCVMAVMVTGDVLFSANTEYELLQRFVHLLGQPADHLLNDGMYTKRYFTRTETDGWRFKTPQNYWGVETEDMCLGLSSLDNLKKRRNKTENLEWEHCIELLKAMLTIDPTQRITPREVLDHPFISWTEVDSLSFATTEDTPSLESLAGEYSDSLLSQEDEMSGCSSWTEEDFDGRPPAAASHDDNTTSIQSDNSRTSSARNDELWRSRVLPRLMSLGQPTQIEDAVQSDSQHSFHVINISRSGLWTSSSEDSDCEPPATTPEDKDTTTTQTDDHSPAPATTPSRVICVRPAAPENTWDNVGSTDSFHVINISRSGLWTSSSEDSDREPPATAREDKDATNTQTDDHSPAPATTPSRVICVRPAAPENTWDNVGSTDSFLPNVINISRNGLRTSTSEDSDREPPATAREDKDATNTQTDDHSPAPATTPSRVICVRPAAPENTWDNVGSTDSLQAGLTETSEPLVTDTDNDTSTPEDSTAPPQLSSPVSQLFLKKKNNCFRRFYYWMKKNFFCCLTCVDDNEEE